MLNKTLGALFDAIFDPTDDTWIAIRVSLDGNRRNLCVFDTEDEAYQHAMDEMDLELEANSQFGVGA